MSVFSVVVVLQSFSLLPLGLVLALPLSSSPSLVLRTLLGVVDFYSVRVATLLASGLSVSSIARSSESLSVVSFLYSSLVEFVVDLNRRCY